MHINTYTYVSVWVSVWMYVHSNKTDLFVVCISFIYSCQFEETGVKNYDCIDVHTHIYLCVICVYGCIFIIIC